jgi:hypothetical protein
MMKQNVEGLEALALATRQLKQGNNALERRLGAFVRGSYSLESVAYQGGAPAIREHGKATDRIRFYPSTDAEAVCGRVFGKLVARELGKRSTESELRQTILVFGAAVELP